MERSANSTSQTTAKVYRSGDHDFGFIGEEIAEYFPEIVAYDPDAPGYVTGMDYSKMTPVLLQAIKEQQDIINKLAQRISDLEKKVGK